MGLTAESYITLRLISMMHSRMHSTVVRQTRPREPVHSWPTVPMALEVP
jgi:hypothetical protein